MTFSSHRLKTIALILFLSLFACQSINRPIPSRQDTRLWSRSSILKWFKEKREGLNQISAWAKIDLIEGKEEKSLQCFMILNNAGEGRVEGLGPWKMPVFYLIFDPESVYFYLPSEDRLYLAENSPKSIQILTGIPLELSLLFDAFASLLPSGIYPGFTTCYGGICLRGKDHEMEWEARIAIEESPLIKELKWLERDEYFSIIYGKGIRVDGYELPKSMDFLWSDDLQYSIGFKSLKVNQPLPNDIFFPDEGWFKGEVVDIKDDTIIKMH